MKEGSPDIEKQKLIIKYLSWIFDDQQKKPVSIILTNCVALTDKKLRPFWHNNLKYLDFRYSSINTEIVGKISHQCKNLKKLYLSKCDQLESFSRCTYFCSLLITKQFFLFLHLSISVIKHDKY